MGADVNGSHHIWVAAESTGLGDGKHAQLPDSSRGQCCPAAFPRLHKLSGDFQLLSPLQRRPELKEEGFSPTLLHGEHKALFLSSKACFFPRAGSPAQRERIACSTGPLSCKTRTY